MQEKLFKLKTNLIDTAGEEKQNWSSFNVIDTNATNAIRKLEDSDEMAEKEFVVEVEILGYIDIR